MHERLLHTAWADLAFTLTGLKTTGGDCLELIDQGRLNGGSGPDFSMAYLRIGGLRICGSVEIHLRASDWYRHGHHKDPAYNNVILHTVLEDDLGRNVELEDGTHPPTFCIKPCLSPSFLRILEMGSSRAIPCSGQISYISDEVIEKQLASAGREYFGEKTRRLLRYYDEHLPLTDAWRKMLLHALFDILGVPANRLPMAELLNRLMAVAATGKIRRNRRSFQALGAVRRYARQHEKTGVGSEGLQACLLPACPDSSGHIPLQPDTGIRYPFDSGKRSCRKLEFDLQLWKQS
jgi:hypothetical protein